MKSNYMQLVDRGELPVHYSPHIHAALSVYFASLIVGKPVRINDLAEASGTSATTLRHYIKGIRNQMRKILELEVLNEPY